MANECGRARPIGFDGRRKRPNEESKTESVAPTRKADRL